MIDVQANSDERGVPIDRVGVRNLRYPIVVWDRDNERQHTIATMVMAVDLPRHFKGTHMSRFVEVLNEFHGEMTLRTMPAVLASLKDRLEAERACLRVEFPYFLARSAPVSGATGLLDYMCWFEGESGRSGDAFTLGVAVPITSLCPCSKEISDYGAHNQRGTVSIEVKSLAGQDGLPSIIWIEELIAIAEQSASSPVYPILKRPDERFVTMAAYDKPAFVEDVVRDVAVALQADERVAWFRVLAENRESIHNHDAFAEIEWFRDVATERLRGVEQVGPDRGAHAPS